MTKKEFDLCKVGDIVVRNTGRCRVYKPITKIIKEEFVISTGGKFFEYWRFELLSAATLKEEILKLEEKYKVTINYQVE